MPSIAPTVLRLLPCAEFEVCKVRMGQAKLARDSKLWRVFINMAQVREFQQGHLVVIPTGNVAGQDGSLLSKSLSYQKL